MNEFWYYACIRAGRTMAQTALATIGTAVALSEVDWKFVLSASVLAGIMSLLTSVATGLPEAEPAIEATDDDVNEDPVKPYEDEDNYDDQFVDESVDEGDYDDVE